MKKITDISNREIAFPIEIYSGPRIAEFRKNNEEALQNYPLSKKDR